LVGLTGDFDIDLTRSPGVRALEPPLPGDYSPSARVERNLATMRLVTLLCLGLPVVAALLAMLGWLLCRP
jgi:hypothetical protein